MRTIAFFSNGGRAGGATTAYHVSYMLGELGYNVLAVDLDPQARLTSLFLSDEKLREIYGKKTLDTTLSAALKFLDKAIGSVGSTTIHPVNDKIKLLAGDPELSLLEDEFSTSWSRCLEGDESALRITTAFYHIITEVYCRYQADFCIITTGSNFGSINRAALIATDYVVIPTEPIVFSLQEVKNVGSILNSWRNQWKEILNKASQLLTKLPAGRIEPIGYTVMKSSLGDTKIVESFYDWGYQMPQAFRKYVLNESSATSDVYVESDPHCLALLQYFYSLMPIFLEVRKPIFLLKPADGAIGAHGEAVRSAYNSFKKLTQKIISLTETVDQKSSVE